jgi:DNA-binding GntR family transcriptional regulator
VELRQRIRELDADGASRLIREHLRTSRDALIGVLRRDARARPRGAARERRSTPKP